MQYRRILPMVIACTLAGCSGRPAAVVPQFDPAGMAEQALAAYDADGDGRLAGAELDASPAIKKHLARYDADSDGAVSEQELQDRFAQWEEEGVGFRRLDVRVTIDGRPLSGATVTFEPEAFMTDWVKPATATTDRSGMAKISVAPEDLPAALKDRASGLRGVCVGAYRVKVTHPSDKLPPAYPAGDALGAETSRDAMGPLEEIQLSSHG
ncbi:hypothetical protein Pla123a_17190 [Posidoniimonas polymericola]|uniref:EF-hand domain-containing protein n=1 Tax=Posidoniimonas polymericola TaxID=2528002 RepID=A0A5C5YT16_9BACT|nr:hypothetical protein [Posidoniimonas polymericola]TWT77920.1 hypothetical protein Pla123a_17190 [Posidoniimonas polymericola]